MKIRPPAMLTIALALSAVVSIDAREEQDTRLDTERYAQLREVERYQIDVAYEQYLKKNWAGAQNEFRKYLRLYPAGKANSYAQHMLGRCKESNRRVNEAQEEYQRTVDYYPRSPETPYSLYRIAVCHGKSGEFGKERKTYLTIVNDKRLLKHQVTAHALWQLSVIASGNGEPDYDQVATYRKRIVINHKDADGKIYRESATWLARHYAIREDDPISARQILLEHTGYTRETAELWMADRYLEAANATREPEKGKVFRQKARDIWANFHTKFPNTTRYARRCLSQLARSYRDEGDYRRGIETGARYLTNWPNDDDYRVYFGHYLEELKRWDDARTEYAKLFDRMRGLWERARSYHREGKADEALDAYEDVLINFARAPEAYFQMGEVHYHLKQDYEEALKCFRESEYQAPRDLFRMADCLRKLKRYDAAITQYAEIVTLYKNSAAQAYLRMTRTYLHDKKEQEQAVKVLKLICRDFPGTDESSQAHRILEDLGIQTPGGGLPRQSK